MKMIKQYFWQVVTILTFSIVSSGAFAAAGNYSSDVDLRPVMKMIKAGDYESAINRLHDELDIDPDNPDIMALLGFSYRKSGQFEDALTFYQWALRSEPDHIGANEYLGELYLETNQFDKAVQQLEILDNLCRSGCKEYTKLKNAIDSYQDKTASSS
ncbi:MAG: tetratricopeptide repeat protein [Pseudomonadota bacterium]